MEAQECQVLEVQRGHTHTHMLSAFSSSIVCSANKLVIALVQSQATVPDIIKFTYYHCASIDYSILCERGTLYSTTQYYTLVLYYHIQI